MERLHRLLEKIEALTIREKLIVSATLAVALLALWDTLLMAPLDTRRAQLAERMEPVAMRNNEIAAQIQRVIAENRHDPNDMLRDRIQRLEGETELLDRRLKERTVDLISPAEMARVLDALLGRGVELVSLHSLPARPLIEQKEQENRMLNFFGRERKAPNIYRHTLVLTFRASYLDALRYLQSLAELPWMFSWEHLTLEAADHPWCTVTLTAHTLSLSEEWVGG